MIFPEIYSATGMMELIQKIGFLPLLDSGIEGFSAEDIVAEDCIQRFSCYFFIDQLISPPFSSLSLFRFNLSL